VVCAVEHIGRKPPAPDTDEQALPKRRRRDRVEPANGRSWVDPFDDDRGDGGKPGMSGLELFNGLIDAFMARDLDLAASFFADDAVLIDPHYPQPRMQGRAQIERGLRWGLSSLAKPGFTVRRSASDGDIAFFEVDTRHVLKIGMTIAFEQVFVLEWRGDKIVRLQAYEPYPAPGVAGLIRRSTRLAWRLKGWL
jgi:ketosteroid isomerase-like protein